MGFIKQETVMERAGCVIFLLFYHTCSGLEVTVPSSHIALFQTRTLLPCTFTVDNPSVNPQFLAIFWHFGNIELLRYDNKEKVSSPRVSMDEQELKRGNASLSIHSVTISDQGTYKCLVIYSPNRQHKDIQLNIQAVPALKIHKKVLRKDEKNLVHCSITDFFPKDITVRWLRNGQDLGSASEKFQMNADGTYNVNSSVTISPIEATDNPVITCQVEHESLLDPLQDAFRVEYGAAPSVQVTSSKTPDGEEQIYMCEARGYFPETVEINWLLDGKRTDPPRGSDKSLFNKEIYYRILLDKDKRPKQISCEVQHETLYSPITETLEVQENNDCKRSCHFGLTAVLLVLLILACGILAAAWYFITKKKYFQKFQVSQIHREPIKSDDEKVTLYCVASNCTMNVVVTWTVKVGENVTILEAQTNKDEESAALLCSDYTVRTDLEQSDNLYNVITALRFKPDINKNKDREVMCNFLCDGRNKERRFTYKLTLKKPEMSAPIKLSLSDSGDVLCSVTLETFYPRNIQIKWSCGVGHYKELDTAKNNIIHNSDQTCNAVSECRVPGHLFKDPGFRVRVTWSHQSMDETEHREVSAADFPCPSVMDEIIIPPLLLHGTEAKLQCRISGYFPGDLDVKWIRREAGKQELYEVSPSDKYKIPVMEVTQQSDKTYTCTASLIVSVSVLTDHGAEFICRVTHPTLVTPLKKRTGELSVTGIPTVNVTHLNNHPRAEILHFFPKDITVMWSRSKSNKYETYEGKKVENEFQKNDDDDDGTYICISDLSVKTHKNKSYKVTVEHETLKRPIEKIIVREKDKLYLKDNENRTTLLPETLHQKEISNSNVGKQVSTEDDLEPNRTVDDSPTSLDNKDGGNTWKKFKKSLKLK
ncbi:uncharacterized protein LOC142097311 isoform X1 [Mixophyes fleayi]|uniref:uncharacterized protein LOC142097311 isoform X1 n=1 Tax=Mixophyes fleayi TaxID=3061075 RepID=UPI003F4DCD9A